MRTRHTFDHVASGSIETPVNFKLMYNRCAMMTGASR
jgi:hypothetical protein